jgi:hypothetical protein
MRATSDFQKISKGMKGWMEASPQSEMQLTAPSDGWLCRINGNMAWISYDEYNVMVKTGAKIKSRELRVLEKMDGKWKISSQCSVWDFSKTEMPMPNPEEGRAFQRGNLEAFMGFYVNAPHVLWTVTNLGEPGDVLTYRGYDALKGYAESMPWFKTFKPEDAQKPVSDAQRDNWQFQFRGNIAMVNFEEHWINDKTKAKVDATVIKNFERINGQWKLITTSALADFKDATPPIRSKY